MFAWESSTGGEEVVTPAKFRAWAKSEGHNFHKNYYCCVLSSITVRYENDSHRAKYGWHAYGRILQNCMPVNKKVACRNQSSLLWNCRRCF